MEVSKIDLSTIKAGVKNVASRGVEEATKIGKFTRETAIAKVQELDSFSGNKISTNLKKINKDTVLGAGISIAAIALAIKCLKGVFGKISDIKSK